MGLFHSCKRSLRSDVGILILLALAKLALHVLTNNQYGFHRDELATLDDAHYLAWGYVAYPPFAPAIARLALVLFGSSLGGLRFFAALAQSVTLALAGLMARELGGNRRAQMLAAVAVAIAPLSLSGSQLFQYVSFDFLWWVLLATFVVRLLKSDNPRWWLAIGATIGVGMLTKYTMIFLVAGVVRGVFLTPVRKYFRSPWLWGGVAISLILFLPHLIWQMQHDFISIDFLLSIHARDIRLGRTDNFLIGQLFTGSALFTIPLALAGFYFVFFASQGKRFRMLGWMFVIPLVLFMVTRGRNYYQAPAYPMMLAAGAVWFESWSSKFRSPGWIRAAMWSALAINGALELALILPIAPVNSAIWNVTNKISDNAREEIGWPDLVQTVAIIRDGLSADERAHLGILASNYGEAGAIDLYGSAYGLPQAISGINSYWLRGYGDSPPQTLIVLGFTPEFLKLNVIDVPVNFLEQNFESCRVAGHITNRYGVLNEETTYHSEIFVCHQLRQPWPEFWKNFKYYG